MSASLGSSCHFLLRSPHCSNRALSVGYGNRSSRINCSLSFALHQSGSPSLFSRHQRPENGGLCNGGSRWPSRTWRSRVATTTTASSSFAVDETVQEVVQVKIKVGPVRRRSERVYRFQKIFGPSSSIVSVTLPKPLGLVFVESPLKNAYGKNCVMVGELVVGGNADRASRVAQLFVGAPTSNAQPSNTPILNGGVMPGDILRATTTAGVIVDFFGIRRPQRVMDLYVADGRPWHLVMRALTASFVADGELTLVLERRNSNF